MNIVEMEMRLRALEMEVEFLKIRLGAFEQQAGTPIDTPKRWNVSWRASQALRIFFIKGKVSKKALHDIMYSSRGDDAPYYETVRRVICDLRKALAPHGIVIATIHGFGWELTQENRDKLIRACADEGVHLSEVESNGKKENGLHCDPLLRNESHSGHRGEGNQNMAQVSRMA